jgi:hypothetical protein
MAYYVSIPNFNNRIVFPAYTFPVSGIWTQSAVVSVDSTLIVGSGQFDPVFFGGNDLISPARVNTLSGTLQSAASLDAVNAYPTSAAGLYPTDNTPFTVSVAINLDVATNNFTLSIDGVLAITATLAPALLQGRAFPQADTLMQFNQESGARLYSLNINNERAYDADTYSGTGTQLTDSLGTNHGVVTTAGQFVFYSEAADSTAPVITLVGSASISQVVGGTYTELGATATDNVDTGLTVVITGTVNPATLGVYTVNYNVSDAAGNAAAQVTRTVTITAVADTTIPVISLLGSSTVNVVFGATYTDAGATATDNIDGTLTGSIVTVNPVNTSVAATYTVTYNVSDGAGNAATQVTRTVIVAAAVGVVSLVMTLTGIPDGVHNVRVVSTVTQQVIFYGTATFASGVCTLTVPVAAGVAVEYYAIGATSGGLQRGTSS